jgi:hypothetical protein
MSDERLVAPPTGYPTEQSGYEPLVTHSSTQDTIKINLSIEMRLDPEKLRCLQDSGITCTSNVVT